VSALAVRLPRPFDTEKAMPRKRPAGRYWIVAIESYVGDDTGIDVWGDHEKGRLYFVVETGAKGASVYDRGYRTYAEAKRAIPEAR
jgi:hypothetical protein